MQIKTLTETPTTSVGTNDTQAPRFGRSDTVLEKDGSTKVEETSTGSGSVASVATPMGGMQRRSKGSMFAGIKTSAKFPNSKPAQGVAEGKEELHTQLQSINQKLKLMRGGPVGEPNSMAFVEKRKELLKQKEQILSQLKQGVAEGLEDLVQIEYWQQETMESGRWVKTKPMPRVTAEKIVGSFERGEIVDVEQGVAEGDDMVLDEKSKSKAQFRMMAAVANNPKFAKKVGISQDVAKEFHSADKKSNYKSLPKKVDEAELSEEQILAKKLQKHLDMFKKGLDHELGTRPKSNDIQQKVDEVSSELLSRYKKGAAAQASQLDKEAFAGAPDAKQKIEKSNKRYSGIVKATKKQFDNDMKEDSDPCWDNYRQLGMKKKNGKSVPNCIPKESVEENFDAEYDDEAGMFKNDLQTIQRVSDHLEDAIQDNENLPEWCQAKISQAKGMVVSVMDYMISQHENGIIDTIDEDWQKVNKKDKTDGMSSKAVKAYRRENPGSKLKTAVTTKPSKLKKGSKAANRRKSFCARMSGMKKAHASAKTKRDPDSPINKALRRWNCESVEQLQELLLLAEQLVIKKRKM